MDDKITYTERNILFPYWDNWHPHEKKDMPFEEFVNYMRVKLKIWVKKQSKNCLNILII